MSNEQLKAMQKELDKVRAQLNEKRREVISLLPVQQKLVAAEAEIKELKRKLTEDLDKAKTEGTLRAKEQIEELRTTNEALEKDLEATKDLLDNTAHELKDALQKARMAEAHMKQMAEEHVPPPPPPKTYRKDRIRRSQR